MTIAQNATDGASILAKIRISRTLLIGSDDEVADAHRVAHHAKARGRCSATRAIVLYRSLKIGGQPSPGWGVELLLPTTSLSCLDRALTRTIRSDEDHYSVTALKRTM